MRPRFVLFGDSITQQSFSQGGWGAALADRYARKVDVVLRGYSGYNTRWALFLLEKIFPTASSNCSDAPLLVTVFFGANDATLPDRNSKEQHVPILEYKENLSKIISRIKSVSDATLVVLITPPPVHEESLRITAWKKYGANAEDLPSRVNDVTGTYAQACIDVAKDAGVPVIDIWSSMQEHPSWQKTFLSDGLHLSLEGNAVVFDKLLRVLNDNGLAFDALKWDFPEHSDVCAEDPAKSFC